MTFPSSPTRLVFLRFGFANRAALISFRALSRNLLTMLLLELLDPRRPTLLVDAVGGLSRPKPTAAASRRIACFFRRCSPSESLFFFLLCFIDG